MLLFLPDLGRMYNLVSRIQDGLGELKKLLETHIHNQGLAAIEKCGEAALNASISSTIILCLTAKGSHCKRPKPPVILCGCITLLSQLQLLGTKWFSNVHRNLKMK